MNKNSPLDVTIVEIRRRLFDGMLMAMAILSVPALAASLYRIKHTGWTYALSLQIVLFVLIWCIYFSRNTVSVQIRTAALLILFYTNGFAGYLSYGLSGSGPQWIMMAVVLTTLFYGLRMGLAALAVNVLFVIGLGFAVTRHWVKYAVDFNVYNEASSSWMTQIAAVGFFLGIVVVVADRLYSALIDALGVAQRQTVESQQRADDLQKQIAERKQAEDRLTLSEQQMRAILQASPIGIGKIKDRVFEWVNEQLCQVTGYRLEEFQGRDSLFLYENETEYTRAGAVLYREGTVETQWVHKNGDLRNIFIQISQTTSYAYIFTAMDITERKRDEEALMREKNFIDAIFNSIPGMLYLYDAESGRLIQWNEKHKVVSGYSSEELSKMHYWDWWNDDDKKVVTEAVNTAMLKGFGEVEASLRIKDGSTIPMYLTGSPLTIASKQYFTGIAIDITERKRVEEERRRMAERLQRAEKMEALGQLAGGVAHDLNNVLGVLTGYSELLLLGVPEGHQSRGYVEQILQSSEKGAAIIQDLLTLARRGVMTSNVINLNTIVSGFLVTPVFEKIKNYHPRVTFRTECEKDLLNIKGSPVHLEKTLMNLVSNAAEAISGEGEVTICTESRYLDKVIKGYDTVKEGDYAILSVSDTGMGIHEENKEKIFEPFYTKKVMGKSGTGLGLAIVWGTIKDHNGYIDIQTKVGEGTTFTLYFPVTREEMRAQQQKVPIEQYQGKGEFVLVVDDIAEQRDLASRLLTVLGYESHVVSSGEEAVEYLKTNNADLLVLDMIMAPGIDGLETYQKVLEINPRQKAILVSGFSETERVREAQHLGAGALIKKPYVMEKIGMAIRDELNR